MKEIKTLVSKAKADKNCFGELYEATKDKAYFIAARYVDEADVADVLQDSYISAMQGISSFDESKPFEPWLHTIIRNKCLDLLKKKKPVSIDGESLAGIEDSEAILPAEYLESEEKRRAIIAIVDKLPSVQRLTVNLFYLEGMRINEIAEIMQCPASTVTSRLQNARKAIREAVLMEEKKGNKLYGAAGTPFLAELFRREMESGFYKMPSAMSAQVSSGISAGLAAGGAVGGTVASSLSIGGKIMAMSFGVKAAAVAGAAIVLTAGIAIPVHIHNENEKAVAAMAVIQQQEADEQARLEAAEMAVKLEADRIKAECDAIVKSINQSTDIIRLKYDGYVITSSNLITLSGGFSKLNAFLAVNDTIENEADIKAAVQKADQLIVRLDLEDPKTVVSDKDADKQLSALREAIGMAVEQLGLEDAICPVDRIELAQTQVEGTAGDIMSVQATVYPTMIQKGSVLAWSSSNSEVVDVDTDSGEMALLKAGECTVKVIELGSGKEVTLKVIVKGKTVAGTEWYTAESAEQFTQPKQGQQPAGGQQASSGGGQQASSRPPSGKEINGNDLPVGTVLPGGIVVVDDEGFTPK